MAYVYCHYKSGTNEVFYVGIGSIKRAYSKKGRNEWWKRIYNIASRTVHVIDSGLTSQEAKQLEIETIKKLKYNGFELCNLTNGGEGSNGYRHTEETKKLLIGMKELKDK